MSCICSHSNQLAGTHLISITRASVTYCRIMDLRIPELLTHHEHNCFSRDTFSNVVCLRRRIVAPVMWGRGPAHPIASPNNHNTKTSLIFSPLIINHRRSNETTYKRRSEWICRCFRDHQTALTSSETIHSVISSPSGFRRASLHTSQPPHHATRSMKESCHSTCCFQMSVL
ncbi:CYFA0S13e03367g1_1 [Cyberlindnera fabianii]|uniref:CYFA0S13e03367g1_1 n=1 Tax=Cyberlindnera fabianii TaxID=36022 RepID=A0A061B3Q6_CYBFA|nr:CYFA0S13e03367g1_1 [Cyberlindnera fabianii]